MSSKTTFLQILAISFLYSIFVFVDKDYLFEKFNPKVVNNYLRSQDIEDVDDTIKNRIFISDANIYQAAGYLYTNGTSPIKYNFQHPPFIKYLFGFSAKYFNLPLLPNIIFGLILLLEILLLGKKYFKNSWVGFLASLLLLIDPVFKEVVIYSLLDLGQITLFLGFLLTNSGILLGLSLASKFYSPILIFTTLFYIHKFLSKNINLKKEIKTLILALLTFNLVYIKAFPYNPIFQQAKIIKFMIDHNRATKIGEVIPMFFGGFILWPIAMTATVYKLLREKNILFLLPILYFLVLIFQLPFTRYFILILPFLYLSLGNLLLKMLKYTKIR